MRLYISVLKPLSDFLVSMIAILLVSPVLILFSLMLFTVNSGSPFFIQQRSGKHGYIFNVIKFKTMNDRRDSKGNLLSDAQRLTTLGRFMRKTSLDELPQLINVIKGDMSLVGPRPLLPEYQPLYTREQMRRHEVRPGITGWAQVNGRNAISWEDKFKLDVFYVDNISFPLDVKILLLTVRKVFMNKGISSSTSETMEIFTGNKN